MIGDRTIRSVAGNLEAAGKRMAEEIFHGGVVDDGDPSWHKILGPENSDLSALIGKTIIGAAWVRSAQSRDSRYLELTFTAGEKATIAGSGNMGDDGVFVVVGRP